MEVEEEEEVVTQWVVGSGRRQQAGAIGGSRFIIVSARVCQAL